MQKIKIFFKLILIFIYSISYFNLGSNFVIFAADITSTVDCTNTRIAKYDYRSGSYCPPTINQIEGVSVLIVEALLSIAIVVFFFMLVLNGFNFLTSQGDPEAIAKTRKGLMFTIFGFAFVLLSFTIISIISSVTGLQEGVTIDGGGNLHIDLVSTFTATPIMGPPGSK